MGFYVFKLAIEAAKGETEFSDVRPVRTGDAPICEKCGGFVGMLTCLPPYRVELELWDSVFGDVAFGPGGDLLISDRFRTAWMKRGLTGLQGFDLVEVVKVKRHKRNKPDLSERPDYYRVSAVRSQAAIDDTRSEVEREGDKVCPACRTGEKGGVKRARRVVLEPGTWAGEDIFVARGLPGTYLVSERFKSFFDEYEITSARLIPAEEYSFDFYPWEQADER